MASWHRKAPTLPHFVWVAAPRGGRRPPWGGPAPACEPPRSLTACGSLPPEGAADRLGAARRRPEGKRCKAKLYDCRRHRPWAEFRHVRNPDVARDPAGSRAPEPCDRVAHACDAGRPTGPPNGSGARSRAASPHSRLGPAGPGACLFSDVGTLVEVLVSRCAGGVPFTERF